MKKKKIKKLGYDPHKECKDLARKIKDKGLRQIFLDFIDTMHTSNSIDLDIVEYELLEPILRMGGVLPPQKIYEPGDPEFEKIVKKLRKCKRKDIIFSKHCERVLKSGRFKKLK